MATKDEALKLALEALDYIYSPLHVREINKVGAAMVALREALAEQPAQQDPVAQVAMYSEVKALKPLPFGTMLYTSPPASKPWVGLTDEETRKINQEVWGYVSADHTRMWDYASAIEAKLKEKNA